MTSTAPFVLEKLPTGISGFDLIAQGGLPRGRSTLLSGTAGSGKTTFALQFLSAGLKRADESGVLVTFEDPPADIFANIRSFGWSMDEALAANRLAVVDATPEPGDTIISTGPFDLSALIARIENAIRRVGAKRVVLDSVGSLFPQLRDPGLVRGELYRLLIGLRRMGTTSLVTMERIDEEGRPGASASRSLSPTT